ALFLNSATFCPFQKPLFFATMRGLLEAHMTPNTTHMRLTSTEEKAVAKETLQKELGWPVEPKRACVCIPAGLSDTAGGTLFEETVAGLLTLPIQLLILGKGSEHFGRLCTKL